jgi:RNA-directed DNA polymerase
MHNLFSKQRLHDTFIDLKLRKQADRQKKTPIGLDGVSLEVFEKNLDNSLNEINRKLRQDELGTISYSFGPLLRIERKKAQGGIRTLHIPRLRDQIVLRIIHDVLRESALKIGKEVKLKSPYEYVCAFDHFIKNMDSAWIVKTDIAQFYDSVPRANAIDLCSTFGLPKDAIAILRSWSETLVIRNGYTDKKGDSNDFLGLPQGLSISTLLAELYAQQIDEHYKSVDGYFRYVDDIIIVCSSKVDAQIVLSELKATIGNIGLKVSPNKTMIVNFSEGLEWLGLHHFPGKKFIHPDKIEQWTRPFSSIQKECVLKLSNCQTEEEKWLTIKAFIKSVDAFINGKNGSRIRWYSLIEDEGQWKKMDRYIHGLIRSCLRKAKISESKIGNLPSIHAKIYSIKKRKESH